MKSEYTRKADFITDLRKNGFIPVAILTDEDIEAIKNPDDMTRINKFLKLDFEFVKECL